MRTICLENGSAQVTVWPDIGRVISFSRRGKKNRLWVADDPAAFGTPMPLYGGLKVMVSPEVLWPQIRKVPRSDPATDGGPWTVLQRGDRHVCMQTFSSDLGVTVTWMIQLHEDSPELQLDYEIRRVEENPFPVHLWSITQVPLENDLYLSCQSHTTNPYRNCLWMPDLDQQVECFPKFEALRFSGSASIGPLKIGTFGRWIAHVQDDEAFVICTPEIERRAYVEGSNLQAFSSADRFPFYEMEVTSPVYDLRVGESFQTSEKWMLFSVSDTAMPVYEINCATFD